MGEIIEFNPNKKKKDTKKNPNQELLDILKDLDISYEVKQLDQEFEEKSQEIKNRKRK